MTTLYQKLDPEKIVENVESTYVEGKFIVDNVEFKLLPHVYPSQKFRTTNFVLKSIRPLLKDKLVCDMGCGPGIVGLLALQAGATSVIQADINPHAVENAKQNNQMHGCGNDKITTYLSDCFDNIPLTIFDIIVFNMPYHNDNIQIANPLEHAFYDPNFRSIEKFLIQSQNFSNSKTEIFIAFSNKGDIKSLEALFSKTCYDWELWKVTNQNEMYDNRIYRLIKRT